MFQRKEAIAMQFKPRQALYFPHGKKAVLLLHAYSGSPNDVRMLARALEKLDYTVYAPLYQGHGTEDPLDILNKKPEQWWQETKLAISFLQEKGHEVAVFGLSMGGVFATRALTEYDNLVGGGFFCSPITPGKTTVVENFLLYAQQVLERNHLPAADYLENYRPLVITQLERIEEQATSARQQLKNIRQPFFMAQAGQDEMIEATGVFATAQALTQTAFTLKWYPNSTHVITVGRDRRQLEKDVSDFLATLDWSE